MQRSPGPRIPRPIPCARASGGVGVTVAGVEPHGGPGRETEAGEEVTPCLVAHVVGTEGDPWDDEVVDDPGEAHPGPGGGSEERRVGLGAERFEAAREAGAARVHDRGSHALGELVDEHMARAQDEDAAGVARCLDGAGDVVEVGRMGGGRLTVAMETVRGTVRSANRKCIVPYRRGSRSVQPGPLSRAGKRMPGAIPRARRKRFGLGLAAGTARVALTKKAVFAPARSRRRSRTGSRWTTARAGTGPAAMAAMAWRLSALRA